MPGLRRARTLSLGLNLELNVSQVFVGDEVKIGQLLAHVIQYALDSTREGSVLITAVVNGEELEETGTLQAQGEVHGSDVIGQEDTNL